MQTPQCQPSHLQHVSLENFLKGRFLYKSFSHHTTCFGLYGHHHVLKLSYVVIVAPVFRYVAPSMS
jgi:hypothetical protein